ncbi:MAG: aromatic ring-hydroxylating dioxygenase subunit alpha [Pseudomonadota bacterium]
MSAAEITFRTASTIESIQQSIIKQAELPLQKARALPAAAYTDEDYFNWEKDTILKRNWLSVAHISQIPEPGDYINLDFMDERISVVHDSKGKIHVYSRVCVHRGMDIMPPEFGHPASGNCKQFRCPYHHWVYNLDGKLKGAPFMKDHEEVKNEQLQLHEFRSEIWQGFVFVDFSGECEPLIEQFGGLEDFIGRWNIADMEMVAEKEWDCAFNWKVLVENFMEPYHHVGAHRTVFQPTLPAQYCWSEPEADFFQVCHLPLAQQLQKEVKAGKPQLIDFVPIPDLNDEDYLEWSVHLATPTFLLFVAADRVYWYRLQPTSAGEMKLLTTLLLHPDSKRMDNYESTLQEQVDLMIKFHLEDMEVCTALQSGLRSAVYKPGPLSELEEPIWQFQRYLARQIDSSK